MNTRSRGKLPTSMNPDQSELNQDITNSEFQDSQQSDAQIDFSSINYRSEESRTLNPYAHLIPSIGDDKYSEYDSSSSQPDVNDMDVNTQSSDTQPENMSTVVETENQDISVRTTAERDTAEENSSSDQEHSQDASNTISDSQVDIPVIQDAQSTNTQLEDMSTVIETENQDISVATTAEHDTAEENSSSDQEHIQDALYTISNSQVDIPVIQYTQSSDTQPEDMSTVIETENQDISVAITAEHDTSEENSSSDQEHSQDAQNTAPDFQDNISVIQNSFTEHEDLQDRFQFQILLENQPARLTEMNDLEKEKRKLQNQLESLLLSNIVPTLHNTSDPSLTPKKKYRKKRIKKKVVQNIVDSKNQSHNKQLNVQIDYVTEPILTPKDPLYFTYHKIFEQFKLPDPTPEIVPDKPTQEVKKKEIAKDIMLEDSDDEEEKVAKTSKKKLKKESRLTVGELKQLVERPDVVEMQDVTALDPKLLVYLKSYRNTVPTPRHWCYKRKYLQGKRGIEKPPFELPRFIKETGIQEMRDVMLDKDDVKSLKSKQREKARPKLGRMTIEYQKLHDAFFKWQTKPKMSKHGELYYEGKELETSLKEKTPGNLSDDLRTALGMTIGLNKEKCPPPWLIAMQRYGPPPSYPNLKIHGLNAPIPEGCSFGYFVGAWGKPPVDEYGIPLYGDVFGVRRISTVEVKENDDTIDKSLWGALESESESSEESEGEEPIEMPKQGQQEELGLATPAGIITPGGITSTPVGLETPGSIELRKKTIDGVYEGGDTPALYRILPEKQASLDPGTFMAPTHIYDIAGGIPATLKKTSVTPMSGTTSEGVDITLDPSELEMEASSLHARYEQKVLEQHGDDTSESLSETRKVKRKKSQSTEGSKTTKKLKTFKF